MAFNVEKVIQIKRGKLRFRDKIVVRKKIKKAARNGCGGTRLLPKDFKSSLFLVRDYLKERGFDCTLYCIGGYLEVYWKENI